MSDDAEEPQEPRLGRYELKRALGQGGNGQVFLVWQHNATGEPLPCVAKFLLQRHATDPQARERLLHEARLGMRLGSHPNIVQVFDVGMHKSMPYIVMEYIDGADLHTLLQLTRKRRRGFSMAAAYNILGCAAEALHHAHSVATRAGKPVQIVHRDIKPGNLLVTRDGIVKLVDFGIGVTMEEGTTGQYWRGTARYMSPEHLRCEVRPEMDIYALGVVAWEIVENRVYRAECNGQEHYPRILDDDMPPMFNAEVPEALATTIRWCLHPNPKQRPRADELLQALRRCEGYSRDPELLRIEVNELIGAQRSSGTTTQHLAATPELIATFAVLDQWSFDDDEASSGPDVDVDALTIERPWPERSDAFAKLFEREEEAKPSEPPPSAAPREAAVRPEITPTIQLAAPPWIVASSEANPRSTTEPPSRVATLVQPRPRRTISSFVGALVTVAAVALAVTWLALPRGGTDGTGTDGRAGPSVEPGPAERRGASAADGPNVPLPVAADPMVPPPTAAATAPTESSQEVVEAPTADGPLPSAPTDETRVVEPEVPAESEISPKAVEPPPNDPTPPPRSKPAPPVRVVVALDMVAEVTVKLGPKRKRITRSTDLDVPAGTHRLRWRTTDDEAWHDEGRHRFTAGHTYLVRIQPGGSRVIDATTRLP